MAEKLRMGYVGCGGMAQRVHIPNIQSIGECELVALAEVRPKLGRAVQERCRIPKLYPSHRELAAEWAFLDHMGVNGAAPVGVIASTEAKVVEMEGVLASMDGRERIQITVKGSPGHERELGRTLAEEILDAGGRDILQELHLA